MLPVPSSYASSTPRPCTLPVAAGDSLRISVVIPTIRGPDLLCRCLAAVLAQGLDHRTYEVIVVDAGDTAASQTVVDSFGNRADAPVVRLVRLRQGHGAAAARNAGWRAGYGKVIAFTDDDTVPDADWLAHGERALVPGLIALCGRVSTASCAENTAAARPANSAPQAPAADAAVFVTANAFVRRSALLTVGGFDERFQEAGLEDADLQFRLLRDAGPLGHSNAPVVRRPERPERWDGCLREQRNAYFDALLYKKHPRLYRERILRSPPWIHYRIVALTLAAPALWAVDIGGSAAVSLLLALIGVAHLAIERLRHTARTPEHVAEMLLTSALIPFLSVYWRLRGAIHFRVLFL